MVLPFYKELSNVLSTLEECFDYEIILVDDGSKDRTLSVLKEIATADKRFFYISLSKNFGHQAAITAGLEEAKGDLVITLDSDLQHPPELIVEMIALWKKAMMLFSPSGGSSFRFFFQANSAQLVFQGYWQRCSNHAIWLFGL